MAYVKRQIKHGASTGNHKVEEIIIRKCSIKKRSARLQSSSDGWQGLLVACYEGCVAGIGEDLKSLTTSDPRTAMDKWGSEDK